MDAGVRFIFGAVIAAALTACSVEPMKTLLPNNMRVPQQVGDPANRPKTLSSDILAAIALERVTGRPAPAVLPRSAL